jgi:hypothetical protein
VQRLALFLLAACVTKASASIIQMAITGTTSAVYVDNGPIFGYSSYKKIPDGTPFTLIYTFEDTKGKEKIGGVNGRVITESGIETATSSAPGTNATLQIGDATWEFGTSTRSEAKLSTSSSSKRYEFLFATPARDNRLSTVIQPTTDGYWPTNADWRASFAATSLMNSAGSFSADNGRVSAKGNLLPSTLIVSGVNLDEQWLRYTTTVGGPTAVIWERQWHLARPSPKGGYIVQEVTRTITGSKTAKSPIASTTVKYWEAWQVPAGSAATAAAVDSFTNAVPTASVGSDTVSAVARFYEGLSLPSGFAVGNSPYAGSRLSSTSDPQLATSHATLPVLADATLRF